MAMSRLNTSLSTFNAFTGRFMMIWCRHRRSTRRQVIGTGQTILFRLGIEFGFIFPRRGSRRRRGRSNH